MIESFSGTMASWASADGIGTLGTIVSGQLSFDTGPYEDIYYIPSQYGPNVEVYVKVVTKPNAVSGDVTLDARIQTPGSAAIDCYAFQYKVSAGTDTFELLRIDNNSSTSLASAFTQELTSGDSMGLSITGNILEAWYKPGAGAWTSLGTATDGTYPNAGYLGLSGSSGLATVVDDFGGGTVGSLSDNPFLFLGRGAA